MGNKLPALQSDIRDFPEAVRREIGTELMVVQFGGAPTYFTPTSAVGAGAYKVRERIEGTWRAIYVAKFADAVYVLHAFQKKTQKTSKGNIDVATSHRPVTN